MRLQHSTRLFQQFFCFSLILFIFLWVFSFPVGLSAAGQERLSKQIEQLESKDRRVLSGEKRVRMTYIRDAGGEIIGMEYFRDGQRYVGIGGKEFPVVDVAHTLVSVDRNVILKYGQTGEVHLEHKTDLFWYKADGEMTKKIVGTYRYLRVAMSPDGYVAICGKKMGGKRNMIAMFKPGGEAMSPTLPLPPPKDCMGIALARGGSSVALLTTKASDNWDKTVDVEIYSGRGSRTVLAKGIKYPQGLFLSEDGNYVLVPGKNKAALVNLDARRLMWTQSRFFRMANPYAFNVDRGRNLVMVNSVVLDREKPEKGNLLLNLVSLSKGTTVLEKLMPEISIEGKPRSVFDEEGKLLIRTDSKEFRFELLEKRK